MPISFQSTKLSFKYIYLKRDRIIPHLGMHLKNTVKRLKGFVNERKLNTLKVQKDYWSSELGKSESQSKNCNYRYDSNLCQNEKLGADYIKIKENYLLKHIEGARILEIGCLGGRWSKYFFGKASKIILVDLDDEIGGFLKRHFPDQEFQFYETKGYELTGIPDNSIDYIFSMDSLVRCPRKYIKMYFKEFARALDENGKVLLHLPCTEAPLSRELKFVKLSKRDIEKACKINSWERFELDFTTIKHGVLLKVNID